MTFKEIRKPLLVLFSIILLSVLLFFLLIPFIVKPAFLKFAIEERIENRLGLDLVFKDSKIVLWPVPVVYLNDAKLFEPDSRNAILSAEQVSFRPSLLSLFTGNLSFSHISVQQAEIHAAVPAFFTKDKQVVSFALENTDLDLWNIRSTKPVKFEISGNLFQSDGSLEARGNFESDFNHFDITKNLALSAEVSLKEIPVPQLLNDLGFENGPLQSGIMTFNGKMNKIKDSLTFSLSFMSQLKSLAYQSQTNGVETSPADYSVSGSVGYDGEKRLVSTEDVQIQTPFGDPINLEGVFHLDDRLIEALRFKSNAIQMDLLPKYIPGFNALLPLHFGISGNSRLDVFMKGEPELLTVNSKFNFTPTILSYSRFFSKPSDVPLNLTTDIKVVGGRLVRGDFAVGFSQASLKGSIVGWDIVSGNGEISFLTNNFNVTGWEKYFPFLRGFELNGGAKFFASAKGNFYDWKQTQVMSNVTFTDLDAVSETGAEIKGLNGFIDLSPLEWELRDLSFHLGESSFSLEGKLFQQPELKWLLELNSESFDLHQTVDQVLKLISALRISVPNLDLESGQAFLKQILNSDEDLGNMHLQIGYHKGQYAVPEFYSDAFGGNVAGKASLTVDGGKSSLWMQFEGDRLNLARAQNLRKDNIITGNLFFSGNLEYQGDFSDHWSRNAGGECTLSITNGEFEPFGVTEVVADIPEFGVLAPFVSDTTRFSDIRGRFKIADAQATTNDLVIVANDFHANGEGEIDFAGNVNFRLSVFLMPFLTEKIVPKSMKGGFLGPIPLLMVGTLEDPSLRKDPILLQNFLDQFVSEKFSKIISKLSGVKEIIPVLEPVKSTAEEVVETNQAASESGSTQTEENAESVQEAEPEPQNASFDEEFKQMESFLNERKVSSS